MVQLQRNVRVIGNSIDQIRWRLGVLWTEQHLMVGSHLAVDHQDVNSVQVNLAVAEGIMKVLCTMTITI